MDEKNSTLDRKPSRNSSTNESSSGFATTPSETAIAALTATCEGTPAGEGLAMDDIDVDIISDELKEEYREAFQRYDVEETGEIRMQDVEGVMYWLGHNPRIEDLRLWGSELGVDFESGIVDFEKFLKMMSRLSRHTVDSIADSLAAFDPEGNGLFATETLLKKMAQAGHGLSKAEMEAFAAEVQKHAFGNGQVNYEDLGKSMMAELSPY